MRIVIVSNSTMQPIAKLLRDHEVIASGVADLFTWLIDPNSPAAAPSTDAVVVCPDGESLLPPLGEPTQIDELLERIEAFATRHPSTHVIVTTLLCNSRTAWSFADTTAPQRRFATRAKWDARLSELSIALDNVNILDVRGIAEDSGRAGMVSDAYWYLGRIRYSANGFEILARSIDEFLRATSGKARKVLVVDLDNTLWGGVVGEDGVSGVEIGEEGVGKCFRDFQVHVQSLKEDGTLLAVVSKNDVDLVDEMFSTHRMMVLRRDDFVHISADWSNKADRIANLAKSLDLGLDAFVFIDDNPVERELVRQSLPLVAVPEFPSRPEQLPQWFVNDVVPEYFVRARVLDEDRRKTEMYRVREQRKQAEATDLEGFLQSLEMRLTFRSDDAALVPRLSQLTQKTNQFNLTTIRMTPAELQAVMASRDSVAVACDYSDRFGDEGTIGLAIVDVQAATLENLLLSCRVLGRGVEDRFLAHIETIVRERGHTSLTAKFVATERNGVASSFLERSGFRQVPGNGAWFGKKEL